ncbi:MAG: exodeoxyribonuclease VII large subunit [Burkholderiaceae bacterium]|nr:exodeoxyribonuclease VII large subunit [Burkholderiaceae bacterium]
MNSGIANGNPGLAREILSVGQLNRMVAGLLQRNIAPLWVAGELSNVVRAASGHWYFTLKDASAQVRAVMFRGRAQYVDFVPRDGDRVEVRALVGLYEPRGDYQLTVEAMRRAGDGDLYQRFVQLKARLQAEGLFEPARKRSLPPMPRTIGIVTSPQAAALRDVLTTLRRRAPGVPVIVYPTPVQGVEAPAAIVAALAAAARRRECDVLLLVRGGGSIEDLWAFNDERVARAVTASPIPVVSGVGHETDFTIADFVADLRAPTPTAAAAAAAPDWRELLQAALRAGERCMRAWTRRVESLEQRLDTSARLLRSPSARWQERAARLRALAQRVAALARASIGQRALRVERARAGIRPPRSELAAQRLDAATQGLRRAADVLLARRDERLERCAAALALVSPQAVLERGYAIVQDHDGRVVRSAVDASPGDALNVTLARGALRVEVRERADGVPD